MNGGGRVVVDSKFACRLKIEDAKSSFPRFHAKLTDDFLLKARSFYHSSFSTLVGGILGGVVRYTV